MARILPMQRSDTLQLIERKLSERDEIIFAYLFGSVLSSEEWNDVDVAVYVDPSRVTDRFHYAMRLGTQLERENRFPVDLILLNDAPDHLIHHISKGKLVLNRDDDFRVDFITAAWKRYFDIQPKRLQAYADMLS
jgi:predicted nucleotidyltransferase